MEAIISALEAIGPQGAFCVRLTAPVDDLQIRIGDVPPLAFPLTHDVARALISQAQPAKFGCISRHRPNEKWYGYWQRIGGRIFIERLTGSGCR